MPAKARGWGWSGEDQITEITEFLGSQVKDWGSGRLKTPPLAEIINK